MTIERLRHDHQESPEDSAWVEGWNACVEALEAGQKPSREVDEWTPDHWRNQPMKVVHRE